MTRSFEVVRRPMRVNGTLYQVGQKFTSDSYRFESWIRTGMAKEVPNAKPRKPRVKKERVQEVTETPRVEEGREPDSADGG